MSICLNKCVLSKYPPFKGIFGIAVFWATSFEILAVSLGKSVFFLSVLQLITNKIVAKNNSNSFTMVLF